jgi:hypothetical protein
MTTFQRRTEHTDDARRYLLAGPAGTVELRITTARATVIDETGHEITPGAGICLLWCAAGHDDAVIWPHLERLHNERAADRERTEKEHTAAHRLPNRNP